MMKCYRPKSVQVILHITDINFWLNSAAAVSSTGPAKENIMPNATVTRNLSASLNSTFCPNSPTITSPRIKQLYLDRKPAPGYYIMSKVSETDLPKVTMWIASDPWIPWFDSFVFLFFFLRLSHFPRPTRSPFGDCSGYCSWVDGSRQRTDGIVFSIPTVRTLCVIFSFDFVFQMGGFPSNKGDQIWISLNLEANTNSRLMDARFE